MRPPMICSYQVSVRDYHPAAPARPPGNPGRLRISITRQEKGCFPLGFFSSCEEIGSSCSGFSEKCLAREFFLCKCRLHHLGFRHIASLGFLHRKLLRTTAAPFSVFRAAVPSVSQSNSLGPFRRNQAGSPRSVCAGLQPEILFSRCLEQGKHSATVPATRSASWLGSRLQW